MVKPHRGATVAGSLALAVAGLAAPARAEDSVAVKAYTDCPSAYACLWYYTSYSGDRWQGTNANPTLPSWIDNNSESAYNNGVNCSVHWYVNSYYSGSVWTFGRQVGTPDLGTGWRNVISSMNWC